MEQSKTDSGLDLRVLQRIEWSRRLPWWCGLLWMVTGAFCLLLLGTTSPVRHTAGVLIVRLVAIIWDVFFFLVGVRVLIRGLCSSPADWYNVTAPSRALGWWIRCRLKWPCRALGRHYALWPAGRGNGWACSCGKVGSSEFGWTGETSR